MLFNTLTNGDEFFVKKQALVRGYGLASQRSNAPGTPVIRAGGTVVNTYDQRVLTVAGTYRELSTGHRKRPPEGYMLQLHKG